MILLLAALLFLDPQELPRTSSFRFEAFDAGLPRSGQWRHGFAVADMNKDGLADLAFSSPRKAPGPPVIFLNQRNGQWSRWTGTTFPPIPFDYGAVAAADFDGNGANDLAVVSHYRGVAVVLGDGRGGFVPSTTGLILRRPDAAEGPAPFSSRAVVALDWNADGLMDIAALSDGPRPLVRGVQLGVTVFENLGTSWKPVRATTSDGTFGDAIAAGDIDGDRLPDLVTASQNGADARVLRLSTTAEGRLERRSVETTVPPALIHATDLHDFGTDGRDEIVIGYSSATEERAVLDLVSAPGATTPARRLWSEAGRVTIAAVAAGDLNGDGSADVVAALDDGRLLTFRGDGQQFVTRDAEIAIPEWRRGCAAYALRVADLDGDERDEIIVSFAGESGGCTSGGGIEVWRTTSATGSSKRRSVRR